MLAYQLSGTGHVNLNVYDNYGKLVCVLVNSTQTAGRYQVRFDAAGLSPGTYQCRLVANGKSETIKLLLQ